MMPSYLSAHLEQLHAADLYFRQYWNGLTDAEQAHYRRLWAELDDLATSDAAALEREQARAFDLTKRWFVRVQNEELDHYQTRDDWSRVASDPEAQQELFARSRARLADFIQFCEAGRTPRWYGNVKPAESLNSKFLRQKNGNALQQRVPDLWDLIRFRIVPEELDDLLITCIQFWEVFFDDIVRCHNYYYRPQNPRYRAVHFELCDRDGNLTEIQVLTGRRDAVSVLDHWHIFKGSGVYIDDRHHAWLLNMSHAANVLDARAFKEESAALRY